MNHQHLLETCRHAGIVLKWDGQKVRVCGAESVVAQLLPLLKEGKPDLEAMFRAEEQGYFNERAAIAEYDGELSRADAEKQALTELQTWRSQQTYH